MSRVTIRIAVLAASLLGVREAAADFSFTLPLTTGVANKLDLGPFAGGTTLGFAVAGHGNTLNANAELRPDGSLFAPASGSYAFANPGASYPADFGGDGINRFAGGGFNYFPGFGFGFAGKMTTDTTDPAAIRFGALVGTFATNPTRADWFLIGTSALVVVPAGGAHLYLAVNDSPANSADNNGAFTGFVTTTASVPEPGSAVLLGLGCLGAALTARRRRSRG